MKAILILCSIFALSVSEPGMTQDPVVESDEQVFARACPGAVRFCKEWKEKWAQNVEDPKIRNQTVRECVVDFMSKKTGEPWL